MIDVLRQNQCVLALKFLIIMDTLIYVFEEVQQEILYRPRLKLYAEMVSCLGSNGLLEDIKCLIMTLKMESSLERDAEGFYALKRAESDDTVPDASLAELFSEDGMSFLASCQNLVPRPWVIDDLDIFITKWSKKTWKKAVIFVDNSGADVILGILPFARELLRHGAQVVLAANGLPSINDATYPELVENISKMSMGSSGVDTSNLLVANSGNDLPVIDLTTVSQELAYLASDADLVILEGMGRGIETNLYARFKFDSLKIGMGLNNTSYGTSSLVIVLSISVEMKPFCGSSKTSVTDPFQKGLKSKLHIMFGEKKRKERRDAKSGARLQTGSMALCTASKRPVHAVVAKTTEHSDSQVQSLQPDSIKVPEAYREWEVKVFDWQTQCPTLAHDDAAFSFMYKFIRLLPTVCCEADAATRYTIDERNITDDNVSTFAYQPTGCYVAAWSNNNNENTWELEHCLIDPQEKESRVRIVQVVRLEDSKLDSAFASTQALDPAQVIGVWEGKHAISSFNNAPQIISTHLAEGIFNIDSCLPFYTFGKSTSIIPVRAETLCDCTCTNASYRSS
ncbi:hypothetical protein RND71_035655 [Anisodus tanguticus]|uniref:Damage-control phosphatase ARMT1-like metal-binding domain-containing protein n=1 Tax=Anisodus tanguticus TaxID=243964 RepID=A0AAE1R4P2_9SOLA|nr:hypothetical protein RND71_035655 [Anisodus tanguticus]